MSNHLAQERTAVRTTCDQLRKLLAAEKPPDVSGILQDVGNIEADALTALGDDFQEVKRSLEELLRCLRGLGIITPKNWEEFFGEADLSSN